MEDLKTIMQRNYLLYASYVILERAIPNLYDGLKPVQRRILHTLFNIDDGKLHKVANVVGQTMIYHPHGDAPISEALIYLANRGYLLDTQGNFGNLFTGDPAAAARYIETRLSPLARETMFNPSLTETVPSYDGRNQEPVILPAKIPLLLMQGADGIAVGMATHILPHNFCELLEAEIAILEGRSFTLAPDFVTGGIIDASQYDSGRGKVRVRAKIEIRDPKTLVIKEICYGTTTESLIRSIDEAAKRGKIKIDAIHDYTASEVEIEIKLPRGQYAQDVIDHLYAYTECEVTLTSQPVVIHDNLPIETDVDFILRCHSDKLQELLKRELELAKRAVEKKIFDRTLERIFIEDKLYKVLEEISDESKLYPTLEKIFTPYHNQLAKVPEKADFDRLLAIPIRRITRFDVVKNLEEVASLQKELEQHIKDLGQIRKVAIRHLKNLLKKYGSQFPRRTELQTISQVNRKAIETKIIKVGFDPKTQFLGTKVTEGIQIECTNYDKLLLLYADGTYTVTSPPEKTYLSQAPISIAVADRKTVYSVVYRDPKLQLCFGKRFIIEKFILDKTYRFIEEGMELEYMSTKAGSRVELQFVPKVNQKLSKIEIKLDDILVKGVSAKGVRLASRAVKRVIPLAIKEPVASTLEAKPDVVALSTS